MINLEPQQPIETWGQWEEYKSHWVELQKRAIQLENARAAERRRIVAHRIFLISCIIAGLTTALIISLMILCSGCAQGPSYNPALAGLGYGLQQAGAQISAGSQYHYQPIQIPQFNPVPIGGQNYSVIRNPITGTVTVQGY